MNYEEEINDLKEELKEIKKLLIKDYGSEEEKNISKERIKNALERTDGKKREFATLGSYSNENNNAQWDYSGDIKGLLNMDSSLVTDVFSALGNESRYDILKSLLENAKTVNELMDELGYSTTGKIYHHLNALLSLKFIFSKDGKYYIHTNVIAGFINMIAGASLIFYNRKNSE
ncbi:MAG: winged helix-turn-helix domain-containing protein [Clostridia bacterium]|jgi:predicted transcriptional regulator|nr:winged helix-turn-helix domain-containing protein [Clostridia bacterium]